jgi:hypothetical protein
MTLLSTSQVWNHANEERAAGDAAYLDHHDDGVGYYPHYPHHRYHHHHHYT